MEFPKPPQTQGNGLLTLTLTGRVEIGAHSDEDPICPSRRSSVSLTWIFIPLEHFWRLGFWACLPSTASEQYQFQFTFTLSARLGKETSHFSKLASQKKIQILD